MAVVVMAIGNASGRVLAGTLSDRIGRERTLLAAFLLQAAMVVALLFVAEPVAAMLGIFLLAGGRLRGQPGAVPGRLRRTTSASRGSASTTASCSPPGGSAGS